MGGGTAGGEANGIDSRLPRYLALRDDLAAKIAQGGWNFVDPLPSEMKLAKQYGVALGTMRRAIEELVREGVLERRHGSGTYVRRSDFSGSLSRYLRFRSTHSTIAFQESRVLSVRRRRPNAPVSERLGLDSHAQAIFIDRKRYHDGELLVTEEIWLQPHRFAPLLSMPLERVGPLMYRTYEDDCGQIVTRAEESLKISTADAELAASLDVEPGSPVVTIERTSFDVAGLALEWRRSHARADHFEYRIEIR